MHKVLSLISSNTHTHAQTTPPHTHTVGDAMLVLACRGRGKAGILLDIGITNPRAGHTSRHKVQRATFVLPFLKRKWRNVLITTEAQIIRESRESGELSSQLHRPMGWPIRLKGVPLMYGFHVLLLPRGKTGFLSFHPSNHRSLLGPSGLWSVTLSTQTTSSSLVWDKMFILWLLLTLKGSLIRNVQSSRTLWIE